MPREPETILVLRLGGIGEVLAVTPALRAVRGRFPRARIALLAERPAGEAAAAFVDDWIVADAPYRAGPADLLRPGLYAQALRLAERILRRRWDLLLDFHHLFAWRHALKPLLVSVLSRAPRRVGFGRAFFRTDAVPDPDGLSMAERNGPFLAALGLELEDPRPVLRVAAADAEWIDALLSALGVDGRPVAVCPGSSREVQRWGAGRFREAAARLSSRGRIVLVGSPSERALCDAAAPPGAVNLAGRTTFGRLAALLARASVLVANDSGPLHMAYALGTPVVGIFRPGEVRRWGSYPDARRFRALTREGPGAETGATLPLVSVDEVVRAAEELMHAHPPRP